uniref:VWFA domain-containing protein n=1 Tax=Panagrellus redivivus TaxID=6233 RepID=A0A7E4URB9_PANRE
MTSESYDVAPNPNKHKKLLYGSIAIAVIGVAVLIAGAVMLGIGIHKANKKSSTDTAPAPAGTTAVPSSTLPSGGSTPANGGSTQPGGSTAPVTTTAAPGPPIPDPYWADTLIAFDASFNLLNETEKKLVDGLIIGPNTTRFETIAVLSYAANMSCIVPFGNIKSYGDFQTALQSLSQFNAAGSISSGMATIAQNLRNTHPSKYLNTVFFTSTSDDTDVTSAKSDALLLQDEGSLVVVAVGSADASKLTQLTNGNTSDVIQIPTAGNVDYATYAQQIKNQFYVPAEPTTTTPGRTPLPVHTTATHNPVTTTSTVTTTARTPLPVHTTATHNPVTTPTTLPTTVTTKRTPLPVHTTATHNPVTTTAQPVVTTPAPYLPCKTQMTFISDTSNTLTADQFKTQLAFISSIIGNINYPARIGYGYENIVNLISYGNSYTIPQIQSVVTNTNQTTSKYDLHNALRSALTNAQKPDLFYSPQAVVVFISDTSNAKAAVNFVNALNERKVKITFVLLGSKATVDDVSTLSKNTISWTDLTKPQPESWDSGTASNAYGCDLNGYKSNSIYRFFAKPDTPTPCSSQVVFSADISSTLTSTQFQTQLSFVSSAIAGFSDFSRIAYSYDRNLPIPFGGQFNLTQIQQIVSSTAQIGGAYSLRNTLRAAVSAALSPVDAYSPVAIAIFTSDTSNTGGIAQFLQTIQDNNIVLTLILMGDKASAADLADFNINTVTWKDLAQPQPDNWNTSAPIVYACESIPTTTRGPITVHTTVTHNVPTTTTTKRSPITVHTTATHNVPTTTTTNRAPITVHTTVTHNAPTTTRAPLTIHTTATHNVPTTTPNPGSYQPCLTQVIFALDDTNLQSDAILTAQKAFLSKAIGAINFPDRLALIRGGSTVISYFNQNTTTDFQNAINATQNSGSDFVLRASLMPTIIAGAFPPLSNAPQAAVVFVSNTSPSSIAGSEAYIAALKFFNVKVTLVVYGPNANAADVTNLEVTTINWADPTTQAAPDNWDSISSSVYGCDSGGFRYY